MRLQPKARFLIVNRGSHNYIRERLALAKVPIGVVELTTATHENVPVKMAKMDAGIFFYQPSFSRTGCAPTKLGEFLGCGIPCISNVGVGDMSEVLEENKVGVVLKSFDEASLTFALQQLLQLVSDPNTETRCVSAAKRHFSLDKGVAKYRGIYEKLALPSL
jgi:glycosyltransferase involved in cell wall biosynthesis